MQRPQHIRGIPERDDLADDDDRGRLHTRRRRARRDVVEAADHRRLPRGRRGTDDRDRCRGRAPVGDETGGDPR